MSTTIKQAINEFLLYCKVEGKSYDDQITVIHNSCLVTSLVLRQGTFFSRMLWAPSVMKFLTDFEEFITGGSSNCLKTMAMVFKIAQREPALCKKPPKED